MIRKITDAAQIKIQLGFCAIATTAFHTLPFWFTLQQIIRLLEKKNRLFNSLKYYNESRGNTGRKSVLIA